MDLRFFFKNRFLKQSFGDFAQRLDNSDYQTFKSLLANNSSWYVPTSLFNKEDKIIHKLFDSIDGSDMSGGVFEYKERNSKLEEKELYDWVKYTYKQVKGKDLTDKELSNMKMSEFMRIADEFVKNGFDLK